MPWSILISYSGVLYPIQKNTNIDSYKSNSRLKKKQRSVQRRRQRLLGPWLSPLLSSFSASSSGTRGSLGIFSIGVGEWVMNHLLDRASVRPTTDPAHHGGSTRCRKNASLFESRYGNPPSHKLGKQNCVRSHHHILRQRSNRQNVSASGRFSKRDSRIEEVSR